MIDEDRLDSQLSSELTVQTACGSPGYEGPKGPGMELVIAPRSASSFPD